MAQIMVDHVDKIYEGGVKAVNDLNLHIRDGEFMMLVGPSGCGKSTALRMIAGLEEISAGSIRIGELVVNDLPPKDRDIAMVFQNYALYPHMTVGDNMAFGLKMRQMPEEEISRRVSKAAKILGLEPYLDRKPAALSGGQRQRVAMGRAIVREPQAFLMDEPLSNLDAKLRVGMRSSLARLHERLKVTTVYATHDQVEAMTLGDRVCVLRDGLLQQVDTPKNLLDDPVNLFVAGFIGSPAMNLVTARLGTEGGQLTASFGAHRLTIPGSVLAARPGLDRHAGREVILGIRPADFEDARLADPSWARMPASVDATEGLGSEIHVIFVIDAPPVDNEDTAALVADQDEDETVIPVAEGKSLWTARVSSRSRVRPGDNIELGVDTGKLHFFDPGSGNAIGRTSPASSS
jgi:multiple sugar transport system ATP-binding protein